MVKIKFILPFLSFLRSLSPRTVGGEQESRSRIGCGMTQSVAAFLSFLLISSIAHAEVPHLINLQSLLFDQDGNVSTSETAEITINVVDANGNVLYTETHSAVPVVEGAVNLLIGSQGPTGELPVEILDPSSGTKLLDIVVDGSNPFELMPLTAVPYAMWADKALTVPDSSIESRHIKDGTIDLKDLKPGITFGDIQGQATVTQIPADFAMDTELGAHTASEEAHSAAVIVVNSNFSSIVAGNVQEALEKLDSRIADEIMNRQWYNTSLNTSLQTELKVVNITSSGTIASSTGDVTITSDTVTAATVTADTVETSAGVDLDQVYAVLQNKKTISGVEDLDSQNPVTIWVKQDREAAPVKIFLVGGLYTQAHYTELAEHNHGDGSLATDTEAAHSHGMDGAGGHGHNFTSKTLNDTFNTSSTGSHDHSFGAVTLNSSFNTSDAGSHSHTVSDGGYHGHAIYSNTDDANSDSEIETLDTGTGYSNGSDPAHPFIEQGGNHSHGMSDAGSHPHSVQVDFGSHGHNFSSQGDHPHSVTVNFGNHDHSFASQADHAHTIHNAGQHEHDVTGSTANTGLSNGSALSGAVKTYLSGVTITIDGVDRTADLLALADAANPVGEIWGAFGDGSAGHPFNDTGLTDPGTGYLDISDYLSNIGFHAIQLTQTGAAGGRISWLVQVD